MIRISRADNSIAGQWWWTVDRFQLAAMFVLIVTGIFMVAAASPPVAMRIGLDSYHFLYRHLLILCISVVLMFGVSLLPPRRIRAFALIMLAVALCLTALTPIIGFEIKGAQRWLHLPGFSLQPSEFIKPAFAVVAAWLFSRQLYVAQFPGRIMAIGIYIVIVGLLMMQPDLGMTALITACFAMQFFLGGLPVLAIVAVGVLGLLGLIASYLVFPHVSSRIDRFMNPSAGDTYQIDRSLEAFRNGGVLGTGPGQGEVKFQLPDAHADFVFSVAGEELGLFATLFIVVLFGFIVLRGFMRAMASQDLFIVIAVGGLLTQFGLQALIHMSSALSLIPTKGMTLPFISYGGSSLLSLGIAMGMVLALTRKQTASTKKAAYHESL